MSVDKNPATCLKGHGAWNLVVDTVDETALYLGIHICEVLDVLKINMNAL